MAAACAFCSVAGVASFTLLAVSILSGIVDRGTVELRVATTYALVDCAPPSSAGKSSGGFRERVLPLLAALPAAAAPRGFASLQSHDDSAFVRGVCLGFDPEKDCRACLAAAADNLTSSCLGASGSRRGGVWRGDSCFVAYADANTSSAREDAFREVVFAGEDPGGDPNCLDTRRLVALARSLARRGAATKVHGARAVRHAAALAQRRVTAEDTVRVLPDVARVETKVRVVAQCARDRAAAECARCLGDAARRVPTRSWGLDGWHVRVADVLGYNCLSASCGWRRRFRRCVRRHGWANLSM
uniref:Uncharacterized protein n=1 Tax=Avena sativa TaxID=4498 RepID=A0ACD5VSL3_AVESA